MTETADQIRTASSERWIVAAPHFFVADPDGPTRYEAQVVLGRGEESRWTAQAARLPGVVTEGSCIEEALANFQEALVAVLEEYRDSQEPIPWSAELVSLPDTDFEEKANRWITVDV